MMAQSILHRTVKIVMGVALLLASMSLPGTPLEPNGLKAQAQGEPATWIIQWRNDPPELFYKESDVLHYYPDSKVAVASAKPGADAEAWRSTWSRNASVESFEPNQKVSVFRAPNDPLLDNQQYLRQIHADSAWDKTVNNDMIIAIVDTGVDRSHPDLEGRVLNGINLVDPDSPPDDDNGHGTNVAGVIAALGDNDAGTAGLLWNANILPVKALEADGNGDEDKLGEGIRYAIRNGAKIVVLSLGLNKRSAYMEKIVNEAEEQGVLLVAASGNEGNAVKYPAAYDTVLAVGGVGTDNRPERLSNSGPELDLMAPWVVFTTMLGGGYGYQDGTSMAAPQVAGVAALAWSQHPELSPGEVRNLLRQTAQDLGKSGWDNETGYGLVRADRAVKEQPRNDIYEKNNRQAEARSISSEKSITAYLEAGDDDWFYWDAPFDGTAHYRIEGYNGSTPELTHVPESEAQENSLGGRVTQPDGAVVEVKKGRQYVKVSGAGRYSGTPYVLHVDFRMYRDAFEDNDRSYKSFMLPPRSQVITGTFDHEQDQDWYSMSVDQPGTLKVKVTPGTARMDPVLSLLRRGDRELAVDQNGDGQSESYEIQVKPGQYYIKVANLATYIYPVVGEYNLDVHLATSYEDPYEPNDKSYQATVLNFGDTYFGVIDPAQDTDWYRIRLEGESLIRLQLGLVPDTEGVRVQLLDSGLRTRSLDMVQEENMQTGEAKLAAGTYYLKITSSRGLRQQLYGLRVYMSRMVEGYSDLYGHWAQQELTQLIRSGYVNGYGDYKLYPDRPITRAEAAVLLDRILNLPSAPPPDYQDVSPDHWAYAAIARLSAKGIVSGYSAGEFAPDRNISRMEMMTMLGHSIGKYGYDGTSSPFSDVSSRYWGAPLLRQLKAEGWVSGYDDGTFRPERLASRAEFMSAAVRMLGL